jgi:hypothetical protein
MEELQEHIEVPVQEEQPLEQQDTQKRNEDYEKNIVALRQAKERAERERDEERKRRKEYEASLQAQKEAESRRDPSDIAEYKDIDEVRKELRALSNEINLRRAYKDVDDILTPENIAKLNEQDPELANMIASEKGDSYKQAVLAYKYIKSTLVPKNEDFQKEKDIIASNASKPRSSASVSKSGPLSQINDYAEGSKERREFVWKQMVEAMNSR